jgi:signal transduction histidine kinase
VIGDSTTARALHSESMQVIERRFSRGDSTRVFTQRAPRTEHILWMRKGGVLAMIDSTAGETRTAGGGRTVEHTVIRRELHDARGDAVHPGSDRDFVINLPLPRFESDSLYSVQVRYSYAGIAEELARSRRRSLIWLAALLGLGVLAAIGVAGQFTRPIRALEASFGRVVTGDLNVQVQPERRDEIGHLTTSFNTMVARLRDSQRMAERLAESEHLASLGRLAAGIAHEIRNPLNAILLNLQQMQDRARLAAPGAAANESDKYHERITAEVARLERLVGSFLDLAKSGETSHERTDVADGLRSAVELFRPVAGVRGITLIDDIRGPLFASADRARLPMVWNNLLANAIEATPGSGRVAVRAVQREGAIEVTVEDSGPGIPPEVLPRIWEPFYSRRENGTGLGLAIVRSTVEHHGGTVDVTSSTHGTTMRVLLPAEATS